MSVSVGVKAELDKLFKIASKKTRLNSELKTNNDSDGYFSIYLAKLFVAATIFYMFVVSCVNIYFLKLGLKLKEVTMNATGLDVSDLNLINKENFLERIKTFDLNPETYQILINFSNELVLDFNYWAFKLFIIAAISISLLFLIYGSMVSDDDHYRKITTRDGGLSSLYDEDKQMLFKPLQSLIVIGLVVWLLQWLGLKLEIHNVSKYLLEYENVKELTNIQIIPVSLITIKLSLGLSLAIATLTGFALLEQPNLMKAKWDRKTKEDKEKLKKELEMREKELESQKKKIMSSKDLMTEAFDKKGYYNNFEKQVLKELIEEKKSKLKDKELERLIVLHDLQNEKNKNTNTLINE